MIAIIVRIFTILLTIWQQRVFACSMVGLAVVIVIAGIAFYAKWRFPEEDDEDPGAMTVEELEERLEQECW